MGTDGISEHIPHIQIECEQHPRIFHGILFNPHNTIMDVKNVMLLNRCNTLVFLSVIDAWTLRGLASAKQSPTTCGPNTLLISQSPPTNHTSSFSPITCPFRVGPKQKRVCQNEHRSTNLISNNKRGVGRSHLVFGTFDTVGTCKDLWV